MKRWLKPLLPAFFLLCLAAPGFAEYRQVEIESLRVIIDTDWSTQCAPGYFPIRLDITNLGENREIRIVGNGQRYLDFRRRSYRPAPSMFGGSPTMLGTSNFSQTVQLKRGDRVKLTIPVPIFGDNESFSLRLWENGKALDGFISNTSVQSAYDAENTAVLFVAAPSTEFVTQATGWMRSVFPSSRARFGAPIPIRVTGARRTAAGSTVVTPASRTMSLPPLDFVLEPERLPSNWQGFTSLRAVAIGPTEWEQLSPPQKEAILTWTASGGDLLLIDRTLESVVPPANQPSALRTSNERFNNYYLGRIHMAKSTEVETEGFPKWLNSIEIAAPYVDWTLPANRAMDWGWIAARGFRLPIEGVGGLPTKAYLSMLVLFTVVIGPLNYLYLWRRKQQVLMVVTVPAISLVFIGILAAYAYLGEGLAVRGRAASFTLLDQTTKQAATRASVSLYAGGIAPSGGLSFPAQFAIFPLGADGAGVRGQLGLDLTESQRFSNGMLEARSPSNFEEISFGPARERLSFERTGDAFNVVNGLGSNVTQLYYRDNDRIYALKQTLAAGERASLSPGKVSGADVYADALKSAGLNPAKFQMLIDNQRNGSYLAVLEKSPFWDPGVTNFEERDSFHFVLGYVEGQP